MIFFNAVCGLVLIERKKVGKLIFGFTNKMKEKDPPHPINILWKEYLKCYKKVELNSNLFENLIPFVNT